MTGAGGTTLLESRTSRDGTLIIERRARSEDSRWWFVIRDAAASAVLANLAGAGISRIDERADGSLFLWVECFVWANQRDSKRLIRVDPAARAFRSDGTNWLPIAALANHAEYLTTDLEHAIRSLDRRSYGPDARLAVDMHQEEAGLGRTWYVATLYADGHHLARLDGWHASETWLEDGGLRLELGPPNEAQGWEHALFIDPAGETWRSPGKAGGAWQPIATLKDNF